MTTSHLLPHEMESLRNPALKQQARAIERLGELAAFTGLSQEHVDTYLGVIRSSSKENAKIIAQGLARALHAFSVMGAESLNVTQEPDATVEPQDINQTAETPSKTDDIKLTVTAPLDTQQIETQVLISLTPVARTLLNHIFGENFEVTEDMTSANLVDLILQKTGPINMSRTRSGVNLNAAGRLELLLSGKSYKQVALIEGSTEASVQQWVSQLKRKVSSTDATRPSIADTAQGDKVELKIVDKTEIVAGEDAPRHIKLADICRDVFDIREDDQAAFESMLDPESRGSITPNKQAIIDKIRQMILERKFLDSSESGLSPAELNELRRFTGLYSRNGHLEKKKPVFVNERMAMARQHGQAPEFAKHNLYSALEKTALHPLFSQSDGDISIRVVNAFSSKMGLNDEGREGLSRRLEADVDTDEAMDQDSIKALTTLQQALINTPGVFASLDKQEREIMRRFTNTIMGNPDSLKKIQEIFPEIDVRATIVSVIDKLSA